MVDKHPLVSVVLASYQHAEFIERAVKSVLEQSIEDLEIIVVDDGSTDGTPDVVASIDDNRIKLIRLSENRLENPRNIGLECCQGKYIAFQNSDDEWLPEKLARQLDVLVQYPDTGAVFTDVEIINADGNTDKEHFLNRAFSSQNRTSTEWLRRFFLNGNCLCITSAIVRKSCMDKVGWFRPSLIQVSDMDLWIRIAALAEIKIVNTPLTKMRVMRENNLSLNPENRYRWAHELAQVFERYGEPCLLKRLPIIFPAITKNISTDDPILCYASLAKFSLTIKSRQHRLFADRVLSHLIDDPVQRKLITNEFGAEIIRSFLANRKELAIDIMDTT